MKYAIFRRYSEEYGQVITERFGGWSKNLDNLKARAAKFGRGTEIRDMSNNLIEVIV